MKVKTPCLRLFVLLLFSIALPAGALAAAPAGEVKVALIYDPTSLNMLTLKTGMDLPPVLLMHHALQATDPITGERTFRNSLTRSAEVLENGKDIKIIMARGYTFHTREPILSNGMAADHR